VGADLLAVEDLAAPAAVGAGGRGVGRGLGGGGAGGVPRVAAVGGHGGGQAAVGDVPHEAPLGRAQTRCPGSGHCPAA